jgi:hypothetical protein
VGGGVIATHDAPCDFSALPAGGVALTMLVLSRLTMMSAAVASEMVRVFMRPPSTRWAAGRGADGPPYVA